MSEFIYVAAPYSHEDEVIVLDRVELLYKAMAIFSNELNMHVTTPLFMHELVERYAMPGDFAFWEGYCLNLLKRCDKLIVLKIDGWDSSTGVRGEIKFCQENGIPIEYWTVNEIGVYHESEGTR